MFVTVFSLGEFAKHKEKDKGVYKINSKTDNLIQRKYQ
ncbi:hypothetical protein BD31_I1836, partial [Candidatus Nitrosopumilus salaria BD31]